MSLLDYQQEMSREIRTDIAAFAEKILGLPVSKHQGQVIWLKNSTKQINILRPGNKWGKSLVCAVKHLYHLATKKLLEGLVLTPEEWLRIKYDTLNYGPGYEQAREVLRMARDIAEGNVLIPPQFQAEYGVTNRSKLAGWFITEDRADADQLPYIKTRTGATLYGRSYDEMGKAFKMKALAYLSGDECADIAELWTFTNGTLLPRMSTFRNPQIDYYGTPQPEGHSYMEMIEMAQKDMKRENWETDGMWYTQKGSMFENVFLPEDTIKSIERIADPVLRQQFIYGEYVETGEKYFGFQRVMNAWPKDWRPIERGLLDHKYVVVADFAGGESYWADNTVVRVIDYTKEPYETVYLWKIKGGDVPIPVQYMKVREVVDNFNAHGKLIIDSSALGGKNAAAFLSDLGIIPYDMSVSHLKGEMLASLKIAFDGGQSEKYRRKLNAAPGGGMEDENPTWGIYRISGYDFDRDEHVNYRLDDKKLRTDCVMTSAMGIHWIEMRRPRKKQGRITDLDSFFFG